MKDWAEEREILLQAMRDIAALPPEMGTYSDYALGYNIGQNQAREIARRSLDRCGELYPKVPPLWPFGT